MQEVAEDARDVLGPVHTYPDTLEYRSFYPFWFSVHTQSPKQRFSKNALQGGSFCKKCFSFVVWTGENGAFKKS